MQLSIGVIVNFWSAWCYTSAVYAMALSLSVTWVGVTTAHAANRSSSFLAPYIVGWELSRGISIKKDTSLWNFVPIYKLGRLFCYCHNTSYATSVVNSANSKKQSITRKLLHKPQNYQHHLPPAPGFIAGGRDAVPGRPALLPGRPLLDTIFSTQHTLNSF